jgi:hypothetical protein
MSEHSTIDILLQSQPHEQQQPHQQQQNYGEFGPPIMNRDEVSQSQVLHLTKCPRNLLQISK